MELIDPRQLLVKVAKVLDNLSIPYVVTGGMAVTIWGRVRFTADIDMVIELKTNDIDILSSELLKLSEFGYVDKDVIREALASQGEFNFIEGGSGIKVDFWVKPDFLELNRRVVKDILGERVCFISPEDLILSKLRWYKISPSSRHLEDVESILKISGDMLDRDYLLERSREQKTWDELNKLL
ncbi:MAG: nucleotidyl transferase AbiEii/AbiGii toxin family protein [Candidatus Yanofskybacteria bacterium]|nr:nucleotidyl transferase AbiEii/AbiGii toxin family protein [Candidatus Yanofskybacteria bacterium]